MNTYRNADSKIKPKPLRKMKTTACYSTSAPFYLCAIYRRRHTLSQWGQILYEVAVDFFFFMKLYFKNRLYCSCVLIIDNLGFSQEFQIIDK